MSNGIRSFDKKTVLVTILLPHHYMASKFLEELVTYTDGFTATESSGEWWDNGIQYREPITRVEALCSPTDAFYIRNLLPEWAEKLDQKVLLAWESDVVPHFSKGVN